MTQLSKQILLSLCLALCLVLFVWVISIIPEEPPSQDTAPTTTPSETTQPIQQEETAPQTTAHPTEAAPVIPEFGYRDGYFTCLNLPCLRGIDVSVHQGQIDWQQVKAAGVEFVMIRAGHRGLVQGVLFEDEWAQRNYRGAHEAGIKVGAYFFSQASSPEEAAEEAAYLLQIIDGWQIDMPLVYDWEHLSDKNRTANMTARQITDCTVAFCDTVKAAGYEPMIYYNVTQTGKDMYFQELADYPLWLGMYTEYPDYSYPLDMWQFSCTGRIPGISENVDLNLYFPPKENA